MLEPSASTSTTTSGVGGITSDEEDEPPALGSSLPAEAEEGVDPIKIQKLQCPGQESHCLHQQQKPKQMRHHKQSQNLQSERLRRDLVTSYPGAPGIRTMAGRKMARRNHNGDIYCYQGTHWPFVPVYHQPRSYGKALETRLAYHVSCI